MKLTRDDIEANTTKPGAFLSSNRIHAFGEPAPASKPKQKRSNTEARIQERVVAWLRQRGEPVVRVEEARKLTPQAAARAQRMGAFTGFPDLLLFGRTIALELKSETGRVSDVQKSCHELLKACGWTVIVPFGYDECISKLEFELARSTRPR